MAKPFFARGREYNNALGIGSEARGELEYQATFLSFFSIPGGIAKGIELCPIQRVFISPE